MEIIWFFYIYYDIIFKVNIITPNIIPEREKILFMGNMGNIDNINRQIPDIINTPHDSLSALREIKRLKAENKRLTRNLQSISRILEAEQPDEDDSAAADAESKWENLLESAHTIQQIYIDMLLEFCPNIIILLDNNGRFVLCTKALLKETGIRNFDYIESRYFKKVSQLFQEKGEAGFREIERDLLREVADFENIIISTGGGTACFFDNMELMNQKGETVYLKASAADLSAYLSTASKDRPLLAQKSKEELFDFVSEMLEKREPFYSQAKHTIDSRDMSDKLFDELFK